MLKFSIIYATGESLQGTPILTYPLIKMMVYYFF